MPRHRVLEGEQVKYNGKAYSEGDVITNMSAEEGAAIPWAVEQVPDVKPRPAAKKNAVKNKKSTKK